MGKKKIPMTRALRQLERAGLPYTVHEYKFQEKGGTTRAARELGVEERIVIKTLVMEDEEKKAFVFLMHGDGEVSTRNLARMLGVKSISPCTAERARRLTGYEVGGISPLGMRKELPVYMEKTILHESHIFINGGKKGFLVKVSPAALAQEIHARSFSVKREKNQ